jgi:anhydro-N-acetylmuramic acid kinase
MMAEDAAGLREGPVWALGLMSGTAMDGVDAALVLTDGESVDAFGPARGQPYAPGEIDAARMVHADWRRFRPASGADAEILARAGAEIDAAHAAASARLLASPGAPSAALIGYHGQTVAHAPHEGWTWQLGDGPALARALGRPVAWDFRTADMAAGGQGAPLTPFFHFALARRIAAAGAGQGAGQSVGQSAGQSVGFAAGQSAGQSAGFAAGPVAVLNLGGVGNVTWIDPDAAGPEAPGALLAFDTGPANAPIDDWVRARTGAAFDAGGALAAAGRVDEGLLARNSLDAWAARRPPKSLDRNAFAEVAAAMAGLSVEDGAATLTALSARMAAAAQVHFPRPVSRWLVCGGGRRNPALMAMLAARIDAEVAPIDAVGLDGDMLEAQAFAWLAVRVARGLPLSAPASTGVPAPCRGGRIALP